MSESGSGKMEMAQPLPETPPKVNLTGFQPLLFISQILAGLILVLVVYWAFEHGGGFAWNDYPSIQFSWHPVLMVLSMVVLYSQSILIYRMLREKRKRQLKLYHAIIHGVAYVLAIIGLKAVFDSHNYANPPTANLYSLHSWLGLLTVILFVFQYIAGFISFLYPVTSVSNRKAYMPVHVYFGLSGFVMACLSCLLGITEKILFKYGGKYGDLPAESVVFNFLGLAITVYGFLVLYLVTKEDYKRAPNSEDSNLLGNDHTN